MLITENKIKEIVKLLIENNEQKVREHNYLVGLVRSYNSIPTNQTNKRNQLFKVIQNKAKILMCLMMGSSLVIMWFTTYNLKALLYTAITMILVVIWSWRFPGSTEEYNRRVSLNKKIGWFK